MKGMNFLVQSRVPISRPDDFLAEMLKSDGHMAQVKSRLLKQQVKIKTFEEKKQKTENKKFHKALKDFKMKAKHQEKRDNMDQIGLLKKRIREKGDDMGDEDFDKVMGTSKQGVRQTGRKGPHARVTLGGDGNGRKPGDARRPGSTLDKVRQNVHERNKKRGEGFKQPGKKQKTLGGGKKGGSSKSKRPGKDSRGRKGKKR